MLRMYLGVALFVRGTQFIADANSFFDLVSPDSAARLQSTVLLHYVALTHIFGGFMMTAGLLTRVAALIQVPVLVGALIVSEVHLALNEGSQGFELAALTLFLLVLIFLYGPGTWSSDHYLFRRKGPGACYKPHRASQGNSYACSAGRGPLCQPGRDLCRA